MCKFLRLFFAILVISCSSDSKLEAEIAKVAVDVRIDRFDVKFSNANPGELPQLKKQYPYLFPLQFSDSVWIERMQDSLHQVMASEIDKKFSDFQQDTLAIHELFQHIKYYFPEFNIPKIVTVNSDVDYKNRIIYADSLMLVGLDNYLGEEHEFYKGIQQYIRENFEKEALVVDMGKAIARSTIKTAPSRDFLSKIVYYGKLYYLMSQWMPKTEYYELIRYKEDQFQWSLANEQYIWRYFISNELLFSTDSKLDDRFINPAPFSKFYLELDNESPGRLGQFIGWRIVDSYMKNNEVSLHELLEEPAATVFKNSQYKPKK
ncbi:gliding motility lipoprotein GldB [Galbibacter sp.]|uniref:gliding motility lipoprotein GldB n=1 Tax=Galbibacter sp. TaxID=2918471 RepID=UPI003A90F9A3